MKTPAMLPKHLPYLEKPRVPGKPRLSTFIMAGLGTFAVCLFFTPTWWIGVGILIYVVYRSETAKEGRIGFCPNCFTKIIGTGRVNTGKINCHQCGHKLGLYDAYIVDFDGMPLYGRDNQVVIPRDIIAVEAPLHADVGTKAKSATDTGNFWNSRSQLVQAVMLVGLFFTAMIFLFQAYSHGSKLRSSQSGASSISQNSQPSVADQTAVNQPSPSPENIHVDRVKAYDAFLKQAEADFKTTPAAKSNLERVRKTVVLFGSLADQINEARLNKTTLSKTDIVYVKSVESRLSKFQVKVLPGLRQAYAKQTDNLLWEHDVRMRVLGKSNTVIELTGAIFAANANIKAAYEGMSELLDQLRFKQARFHWYRGSEEASYYDLKTPPDARISMFKFGTHHSLITW